jgi:tRNA(fMet)-specific endonuclease VapC
VTEPAFLLDSNICIYLLEGRAPAALARIQECSRGEVVTSAITYAEVLRGVSRHGAEPGAAERLFAAIPVLKFDIAAARAYSAIPFKRGTFDRLIAAHALSLGVTLVTNNPRDFVDVPDLKVENWTKP